MFLKISERRKNMNKKTVIIAVVGFVIALVVGIFVG